MHQWHVHNSPEEAIQACADFLAECIQKVIEVKGRCHVALPGGNTPATCLRLLAEKDLPWQAVYWYLGDERCLPRGDAERNDTMLEQVLWSAINSTETCIFRMQAEQGATVAAQHYAQIIESIDHLDIAMLGMGEDGHTASLFPGNPALELGESVVPVFDAPKPPAERVSLGLPTLQQATTRIILALGEGKREAIHQVRQNANLPVNRLGGCEWFVDRAALPDNEL